MGANDNAGVTDAVLTAAAAGLLAVSAMTARPNTDPRAATLATTGSGDVGAADGVCDAVDRDGAPLNLKLDAPGIKGKLEQIQGTHKPLAFTFGVVKRFGEDKGSRLAALVAYFSFFSLFPALLAMVTILGFVLEGHDDLRARIEDSALSQFPVIGDSIGASASQPLTGSTIALIVGLAGALWAGMGAMQAAQDGMNTVWHVAEADRPSFLQKRLRSLVALVLMAVLFAANAVVPQITGAFSSGPIGFVLLFLASAVVNTAFFLAAFELFTTADVTWRDLWPGAAIAGVVYLILQTFGTIYVERLKNSNSTYGTFAGVLALLSWLYLLAQMTMLAATINVVRTEHAWPRSLFEPKRHAPTGEDRRRATARPR